ncbi:unnamed protein product [Boreogadus saida]
MFRFHVVATDSGSPSLSSNVSVNVFLLDQNDNPPVILHPVSSNGSAEGVEEVPRNVPAGHLVTKVRAYDADIGYNGWLLFSLQEVSDHSIFGLDRYTGRIRTLRSFTETDEAQHKLVILVKDNGNVSLSATATVVVKLVEPKEAISASDVKSAATDIGDSGVTFYLMITLASVSTLFIISIIMLIAMQCSKTTDVSSKYLPETNYDGTLCHSIQYRSGEKRYMLVGPRMSIGSTIVPGSNGNTLVVPDRRSTSAENDNPPVILHPLSSNGSAEGVEEVPRNVPAGHLVTKVRAYDADIGYNGWLLFSLKEVSDHSLFGLDRYTGRIRTLRSFTETDKAQHKLVILVKDNGNVSLSATATVAVKLVEPIEAISASDVKSAATDIGDSGVTFYLMITLASVSTLFLISIIVLIAMQCSNTTDLASKYLPETNYDGTLCHSIQYRSGEKRYMLVGPRMSIGSTIVPGSNGNTLVVPDRRSTSTEIRYAIAEEVKEGTVVGHIAKDLGLDKSTLRNRGYRIVHGSTEPLFQVNQDDGILYVNRKIDREEVCERSKACVIELKTFLENPLEVHYVAVEVLDVNDHAPSFPEKENTFHVVATDSGSPSLSSNVSVSVFLLDQNDNPPVILHPVSSNGSAEGVEEVPRNVPAGHLVTKVIAYDADIGYNGWLLFSLQEVSDHSLFGLDRYTGRIRTLRSFTETDEAQHKLVILVKDNGNVSLSATATLVVKLVEHKEAISASDVKSAATDIGDSGVTFYLMITLASVSTLFLISIIVLIAMQCSKTTDVSSKYLPETNYDGTLCHSIQYRSGEKRYMLVGPRMSIGSTIVPGSNGNTLVPDRRSTSAEIRYSIAEEVKEGTVVGHIAKDLGLDKSTLRNRGYRIVHGSTEPLFQVNQDDGILYVKRKIDREENDNPPVILHPVSSNGSAEGVEEVPRNVPAGYLVTEVRAYDADIGYNGWLLFSLQEVSDHSLFGLDRYTGRIRTLRSFTETDEAQHKLVILVKDNGNVSLSAKATVVVKLVEPKEAISASDVKSEATDIGDSGVTFYLMITLASVSTLFLISIIVLIAMQCSKTTDVSSKYLPETNYDGTLCHSIQYRSGEKRYMLVGPRMSIGSTIVPGSNGNTLVVPDRRSTSAENDNPPVILHPLSSNGSAEGVEEVPRNVPAGHLVTKVRAYDADIGYNGWLLFSLQEVSDHSLFGLDRYTGRIRTLRSFTETDEAQHKLVILVKDNGNVSLSATATVVVKLVEPKEAISASDVNSAATDIGDSGVTFYLMITLASVSTLFLISIIVLIAMQCSKTTDVSSKHLPETNYDGTLCHSIQYRSGEKRYMLVGPRMSIGSTIVPGSNGNTLVVPDRRSTSAEPQTTPNPIEMNTWSYRGRPT